MIEMQSFDITLKKGGKVSNDTQLVFGYAGNKNIFQINITLEGEWIGTTVRAVWHISGTKSVSSLVTDGVCTVPSAVTATSGTGSVTFEGVLDDQTIASEDVLYRVRENGGIISTGDPEVDSTAWEQYVKELKDYVDAALLVDSEEAAS